MFEGLSKIVRYDKDLKMHLDLDEWVQQHIYFLGYFDPAGISLIKKRLPEGGVFLDIGANVGSYTLVAANQVGISGRVIAFEPVSACFNRLTENINLNGLTNVVAEQQALTNENKVIDLHIADQKNLGMSSIFHHDTESGQTEQVSAVRLDDYLKQHQPDRIDMIKMDIEGAELFALQGMKDTLIKHKPELFIELKEEAVQHADYSLEDIIQFLQELGYKQFGLDEKGELISDLNLFRKDYYNFLFVH
jgi:FkbM family methyltransferase